MNMIQEFINKTSLLLAKGRQIGNASIQIPSGAFIAKNLKDAVTEDQQACAGWDAARLSLEIDIGKHPHNRTGRRQKKRNRLATKQDYGRRMTTGAPSHCAAHSVVNTIPDGEES